MAISIAFICSSGQNRDIIELSDFSGSLSGRGAVGSARGSGLRGRPFKSGRPDHTKMRTGGAFLLLANNRKNMLK